MLTGIDQSDYSKLESGKHHYTFEQCRRIAAALSAVEVKLIDHIVVAEGDFISMVQSGYRFDEYLLP